MSDELEILDTKSYQQEYNHIYRTEKTKCIALRFRLDKDAKYIKIYESIPNKIEFFRKCLELYDEGKINFGQKRKLESEI